MWVHLILTVSIITQVGWIQTRYLVCLVQALVSLHRIPSNLVPRGNRMNSTLMERKCLQVQRDNLAKRIRRAQQESLHQKANGSRLEVPLESAVMIASLSKLERKKRKSLKKKKKH